MVLSMDKWVGKVAIVTGMSSGIGVAIAEQLVDHGLKVVGVARRVERIEEYAKNWTDKNGKLYSLKGDFSKEEDILKTFKWVADNLGPLHILVNNAGVSKQGNLMDADTSIFKTVLDLNVLGLTIATREAVKVMRDNNINGHIIHIGSIVGHMVPNLLSVNMYIASKHAVRALTETLRQELVRAGSKIRVTEVSPGIVTTEMTQRDIFTPEQKDLVATLPFLDPEDIADGVTYVLSTPEHVQVHELMIKPVGEPF